MEFINEFIRLSFNTNPDIKDSFCETSQDDQTVYLKFGLFAKDCLFDLTDNNYEFQITISKSYLEKYSEDLDINVQRQAVCCNTQSKLLDIINCKLTGIHRKIYLESHVLFLLYQSQRNSLLFQLSCDGCAIINKGIDESKIQEARKFILDNLSGNITIPIIASNIGTNQCYLKKGFKEVFDQTIYEFIQENRMIKARHLLQNGSYSITDVAYQVGYASLSSFSQAYKNYFGISPTEQLKGLILS
jgi:AraC-like DNA-binding protein